MVILWKRTSARATGQDAGPGGETIETSPLVVAIPILVAIIAALASIGVAFINREAGLALELERRVTALAVEGERNRVAPAGTPAPR